MVVLCYRVLWVLLLLLAVDVFRMSWLVCAWLAGQRLVGCGGLSVKQSLFMLWCDVKSLLVRMPAGANADCYCCCEETLLRGIIH